MSHWPLQPFNTIYAESSRNGITRPKATRGAGYKMVNMGELFAYGRFWNPDMELVQLSDSEIERFSLKEGDLLFARQSLVLEGTGKCSIVMAVPETTCFESHLIRVRLDKQKVDPHFYYYYFGSHQGKANIQSLVMQVAAAGIRGSELALLQIPVPPFLTQHKIATILEAYDDLIENNLRRIKILEEMAQNLYREWFVKFRFPGHQNARFTDSPLGRIPEGWEVSEFRHLFEIKYGKTLPKTQIADVGLYPVYGAGDVIGYYDKALCQEKCALVTSRGNGSGTVWRTREAAFVTNNSLIILPKAELKHWYYSFVELLLKHSNVMEAKTGSAQPQITIENLNYVKTIVPERTCVEKFCSFVTPLSEQVDLHLLKNTTLRRTRDLLLPRLFSGEVDVSELDIAVPEEATC